MKNVIASSILFFLLIGFIIYAERDLSKFLTSLTEACEQLELLINEEEWEASYDLSFKTHQEVKEKALKLSAYINHEDIDCITEEVFKLTQYVKEMEKAEALASVHSIKHEAEIIYRLQKPTLENIF